MTAAEMRKQVINKFKEEQEITLWIRNGEKGELRPKKVKILKFNPYGVLVEERKQKETFSYWEIKTMSAKPIKNDEICIPEKLKAEGNHKYKVEVAGN